MQDEQLEYLVVAGHLDRTGRFTPRRCRSTPYVHEWPVVEESDVVVELLDQDDVVIHRERAEVRPVVECSPGDARRFRVLAYIGLREEATRVRLRREDVILWVRDIPDAPHLSVSGPSDPDRQDPYLLQLDYSEPEEGAHVTVVYRWGERRFQVVHIGEPAGKIELDIAELPGGEECRFVVSYSNGLRSASDATSTFPLSPIGATLRIARPEPEASLVAGTPIVLEGHVVDLERPGGARPDEHLAWVVDGGEEVARGSISSIDGLEAGKHEVTLFYQGADAMTEASVELDVSGPEVPTAEQWDDWDPTDARFL